MLGGGEGLELRMGHSGPRMTSLRGGDRADGGPPSSCWSLALERADLRRAADKELMAAQGLPDLGLSSTERTREERVCAGQSLSGPAQGRLGPVRRGSFQSLRGRRSSQKRAGERKG